MPYTVSWDDDAHTIVRIDFGDSTNWDDSFASQKEANDLISSTASDTSLIVNFSDVTRLPPDAITQARKFIAGLHPRTEYVVMVSRNAAAKSLQRALFKIYKTLAPNVEHKTRFAADLDEARKLITESRQRPQV